MNQKAIIAVVIILLGIAGYGAFAYMTRPVAAPSQPINGITTPTSSTTEPTVNGSTSTDPNAYTIRQENSHVNFVLDEILRGSPYTVVGTSTEVGGQITVDRTKLQDATVGTIRINARTIKTDDPGRNGMIGRFILKSEDPENEFITFETKEIVGLPTSADIGTPLHFTMTGDLKIAGTTRSETFDVNAMFSDDHTVTGYASSVVKRSDFNLNIPDIPFVANVTDDVTLSIDFTATK
ncbi:MAG: YceI family protein [Patescibacteria group bacterium]